jgi:hypothetical protein
MSARPGLTQQTPARPGLPTAPTARGDFAVVGPGHGWILSDETWPGGREQLDHGERSYGHARHTVLGPLGIPLGRGTVGHCAQAGTTIVTILAGPLNYMGANPQIHKCQAPQPSR